MQGLHIYTRFVSLFLHIIFLSFWRELFLSGLLKYFIFLMSPPRPPHHLQVPSQDASCALTGAFKHSWVCWHRPWHCGPTPWWWHMESCVSAGGLCSPRLHLLLGRAAGWATRSRRGGSGTRSWLRLLRRQHTPRSARRLAWESNLTSRISDQLL